MHACAQARLEPVSLQSFQPPLAKQFSLRQLELMQGRKGLGERHAFAEAEKEFMGRIRAIR